jgi:PAS domain S-box-containing protein
MITVFSRRRISLKLKIFGGAMAVVLLVSAIIAVLARWILVSSLNRELEQRGVAIGQSLAERASAAILEKNQPVLVSLVFDAAQLGERKVLVSYIFIVDNDGHILAHTFTRPFPDSLATANPLDAGGEGNIRLVAFGDRQAIDIAVPVREGIYTLGAVHVGLSKSHIDSLVGTLRTTFLGFIAAVTVIMFVIALRLSNAVVGPITRLTRAADAVSRGGLDQATSLLGLDREPPRQCPAYADTDLPCWHFDQSLAEIGVATPEPDRTCRECRFYRRSTGADEVGRLADSFGNMIWSIRLYRRRLRESEEKYRSLFDSNPDPVFVVDAADSRILDANSQAELVYGRSRKELVGRLMRDLEAPNQPQSLLDSFDNRDASERVLVPKMRHLAADGRILYVNLHACRIAYRGRDAVIVSAADITELVEKDAQLIQASKMKTLGEMSAGIAHELNQPLNAIRMGSDYLLMMARRGQAIPLERLASVTTSISSQVDRAAAIINHLREFGRKSQPHLEEVDIREPIRGVLTILGQQLALQGIAVKLDLDLELPPIKAHANRLEQVFFNLVTNARDALLAPCEAAAGNRPRQITIRTWTQDDRVLVTVADTGCGIAKQALGKIFDPFFTTKDIGQGMGLGLSISYGIIKDYGGDIEVASAVGQGTTFRLSFPARATSALSGA